MREQYLVIDGPFTDEQKDEFLALRLQLGLTLEIAGRTLVIRGELTEEQIRQFVLLVQRFEGQNPTETYRLAIIDPQGTASSDETMKLIERVNPLRPGYERVLTAIPFDTPRGRKQ